MRRFAALAAAGILTALVVPLALADVEFDEGSQSVFGFDADGVDVEGADGNAEFEAAWELFANSVEGARILGKLDGNRGWEIIVRARPGSEFEDGRALYGLSILFKHPNDAGQRRIEVNIDTEGTGGVANLADTIYHEFRHVENWIDGSSEEERDKVHAGTDVRMNEFLVEIGKVIERPKPLDDHTPIYDAIFGRSDETLFRYAALDLGEILTNDSPEPEPDVEWDVNIVAIDDLYIAKVTEETIDTLDALIAEQDGCGDWGVDTFGCGGAVGPTVSEGDTLIGVGTLGPVPYEAPVDPWMFWLGIETDGDPSNNFGPGSGFDSIYEGTDRHYRMFFDPATGDWDFGVEQRDADGTVTEDSQSSAFGFIQGDVAWFVVPDSELLFDDPRIRVALAGFDGSPITGVTAYDPSGELPTDPLIGLDGARAGGQATGSASTDEGTVIYYGPTAVPSGGVLDAEFCLTGTDGSPTVGADFFATLGEPPSAESATHNNGTTDADGCVRLPLDVNSGVGETNLRFSVGFDAVEISSISVLDPGGSVIPYVSPEEFAALELYRWLGELFEGAVIAPGGGGVHEAGDDIEDQDNPFFGSPIDQRDTILPAWDVIGLHIFSLSAIDPAWSAGENGVGVLRALPPNPFYEPVSTGYTAAWFQMASPFDEWEGFGNSTYQCFVALAGLDPSRPTTILASVGDDLDPARDTNFSWALWVSPDGSALTTKTEVNPETRVQKSAESHATLGAIREWTDFVVLIPTEDLTNIELLKPSAGCVPQEYSDYGAHTRDVLDPITPGDSLLSPFLTLGAVDEPSEVENPLEAELEEPVIVELPPTTLSPPPSPPTTLQPVAVGRPGDTPAGDSDTVAFTMMALGVVALGAGAWAFRRASANSTTH